MPDTKEWDELFDAAHDWNVEMEPDTYASLDSATAGFAETLGITLDRPTLEAALFCISNIVGIAWMCEASERGAATVLALNDDTEPSPENQILAFKSMRYVIVKRLDLEMLADA